MKRSREEDLEPSSSPETGDYLSTRSVIHPSTLPCSSTSKIPHLDLEGGEPASEMRCSLPGHRQTLTFASFEEYDVHYAKTHMNRCMECRRNFPTEHFLNLHIEENHDSLVSVRRERGEKTYSCFVEDCDKICSTPQKRRMHLIDKHMFPKDYDFYVVNEGVDRRTSMLRSGKHRRRSSAQHTAEIEERARQRSGALESIAAANVQAEDGAAAEDVPADVAPSQRKDVDMDGLEGAMSALKFVPTSVRFGRGGGRGRGRGGFSKT